MQTVQFKVLNTDTQETNVQMQAENKAQNTQNTEVSGVESTGESAGTKKKTTVSTGQTGVTDAESAKWVAISWFGPVVLARTNGRLVVRFVRTWNTWA